MKQTLLPCPLIQEQTIRSCEMITTFKDTDHAPQLGVTETGRVEIMHFDIQRHLGNEGKKYQFSCEHGLK